MKIGLLSDTHGYFDTRLMDLFSECDEIWHAGDIGDIVTADEISAFKPFRAVFGNIDGTEVRITYPKDLKFTIEGLNVWITHIGGYPGHYDKRIRDEIKADPPGLFISGHSHILKVMADKNLGLLYINPGAAGKTGFHQIRTAVRFVIEGHQIKDLEVIELGKR